MDRPAWRLLVDAVRPRDTLQRERVKLMAADVGECKVTGGDTYTLTVTGSQVGQ